MVLRATPDYEAASDRYQTMQYRASGRSGLKLPLISLGLWHNFGGVDSMELTGRPLVICAAAPAQVARSTMSDSLSYAVTSKDAKARRS